MVDSWLVAHALPPGTVSSLHHVTEETDEEDKSSGEGENNNNQALADNEQLNNNENQGGFAASSTMASSTTSVSASNRANSTTTSGSGTPVRKISAHEFERGGLTKPLVTTVDGAPTFLSPTSPSDVNDRSAFQLIRKRSTIDIQGLNETDLILELVKDICNDLDIKSLCHKILQNVGILTNADR